MTRAAHCLAREGEERLARTKKNLALRRNVFDAVRRFFGQNGFLEVDTPLCIAAPAPEPHIDNAKAGDHFLQASPELHMKRLLCAGYENIFQLCKCFRENERGDLHLPEFTMLEWYAASADYGCMMDQVEELVRFISIETLGSLKVQYGKTVIDMAAPWQRMRLEDAFDKFAGMDMKTAIDRDLFEEKLAFEIEPALDTHRPVFLHDYPSANTPLAKSVPGNPEAAQRFELYLAGIEICNGYSERTDEKLLRARFESELSQRIKAGRPLSPMPERFLEDMANMPDAAGCALGLDRLVMVLADARTIDDVVAFIPEDEWETRRQ